MTSCPWLSFRTGETQALEDENEKRRQHQPEHAQYQPGRGKRAAALARPPELAVRPDAQDDRGERGWQERDEPAYQEATASGLVRGTAAAAEVAAGGGGGPGGPAGRSADRAASSAWVSEP
jgi:hypothetical protein